MARLDFIAGLDIGTNKICCLIASRDTDGEIQIEGSGFSPAKGVKKGVVVDLNDVAGVIEDCVNETGVNVRAVYTGLTGQFLSVINSHGTVRIENDDRIVLEEDVRRVLDEARIIGIPDDRQLVHLVPRGYTLDGNNSIKNPLGLTGMRLEVNAHIITATKTHIQNIERCIQRASLECAPNGLISSAIASSMAVLSDEERELGVLLADIGAGTTDITVFKDGNMFTTDVLGVAGSNITSDIALALKVPIAEAERVKLEKGIASPDMLGEDEEIEVQSLSHVENHRISRKLLAEIIEARTLDIFDWLKKTITQAATRGVHVVSVVLTGGTAILPGITELCEQYLKLPVRAGVPGGIKGMKEILLTPAYSTAMGLVLYGITQTERRLEEDRTGKPATILSKFIDWLGQVL